MNESYGRTMRELAEPFYTGPNRLRERALQKRVIELREEQRRLKDEIEARQQIGDLENSIADLERENADLRSKLEWLSIAHSDRVQGGKAE